MSGRLFDGAGTPIPDGVIESWQADPDGALDSPEDPRGGRPYPGFRGYARSCTDADGTFHLFTVKPGRLPDGNGGWQAPHIDLSVFARGMLDRVITRVYFADETVANEADAVLATVPADCRQTLIAQPGADGYQLDLHLQGEHETVFFSV